MPADLSSAYAARRVVVTGATGFIGRHLCSALVDFGARVHAVSRHSREVLRGCEMHQLDLRQSASARTLINEIRPDVVYHLASVVDGRQDISLVTPLAESNFIGSVNLAQACQEAGCPHVVAVGSADEPSAPDFAPASPYAAAKAASSMYFRMFHRVYGLPVVIVRPTLVYGPGQPPTKLIPQAIATLLQQQSPVLASGDRSCDFVFVSDVVRGLCHAGVAREQFGRTFDLGTGIATKIADAVKLLADLMGQPFTTNVFGTGRRGEPHHVADVAFTRQHLGWESEWNLRDGLLMTLRAQNVAAQS